MNRSANWLITINYKDGRHEICEILESKLKSLADIKYFIFQLEKGENGTYHHQIYIQFKRRKTFDIVKEMFPRAHLEVRRGTHQQAKDYCSKSETRENRPFEWGDETIQGNRSDLDEIYNLLKSGSNIDLILHEYPSQYIRYRNSIDALYQKIQADNINKVFRKLEVIYLFGKTGVGKTSTIMKYHGFDKVYRVTDYKNPFDTYQGQEVIIFDEYHSQLKIELMLNLLDGYPLKLPARYNDKVAQYTKVYIISNEPIDKLYPNVQKEYKDTYDALLRRINYIFDLNQLKIHYSLPF